MPTLKELNDLRDEAYENAKSHGFHDEDHSKEHYLCLVLTELMETVEADRKARYCAYDLNEVDLIEDKADYIAIFEQNVKDTVEDEINISEMTYNISGGAYYFKSKESAQDFNASNFSCSSSGIR